MLIGDGPEAPHVRERVKHRAGRCAGDDGAVPHSEVGPLMSTFDVAVLQARDGEGFHYSPLKLREYFAAGVPVVLRPTSVRFVRSCKTAGVDGRSGRVTPMRSRRALKTAVGD